MPSSGSDALGLDRYAYVEDNPLIMVDPTDHDGWLSGLASAFGTAVSTQVSQVTNAIQTVAPVASAVLDATTGIPLMINDVKTIFSGNASTLDKILAGADLLLNVAMDVTMVIGVGEGLKAAYVGIKALAHVGGDVLEHAAEHAGEDAYRQISAQESSPSSQLGRPGHHTEFESSRAS